MEWNICWCAVVALTFLLGSTSWCAETNHNFAQWEKQIAAFERKDRTNPPPTGAILFTGASTIRRWTTLEKDFPGHRVLSRGFGGSEIVDATHFAERIIFPYAPKMVLLRAGGNEMARGRSAEDTFADFKDFVAKVHAKLPETVIVFISNSPSPSRWAQRDKCKAMNALVQEFMQGKPYLKYLDVYGMTLGSDGQPRAEFYVADGLHFNAAGYALLADKVRTVLPPLK